MRVLYVIDSLAGGGAETSLAAMAPHLRDRGVELVVLPLLDRPGVQQRLTTAGAEVRPAVGATRLRGVLAIRRAIAETRPDVVHTTLFEADVAGRTASRLARVPVVSTLAAELPPSTGSGARRAKAAAARWLDRRTARWVGAFHAVSEAVARSVGPALSIPSDRITVVHRGRDAMALGERAPERRTEVRRRLSVADEAPLVVAAGRQEHDKGFDLLLAGWPAVLAVHPDAQLVIAGRRGGGSHELERLARETSQVHLVGNRDDVPDLIAAGDVVVAPSRREGLPGTVIEAMMIGTPLVVSDIAPMIEVLGSDTPAEVVTQAPRAVAEGVIRTLGDPETAAARAAIAQRHARATYSLGRAADGIAAIYEQVVLE